MAQKQQTTQNTASETVDALDANVSAPTLVLRLEQPRDDRRVAFHTGVIDNEHMNRKKSKCCCIYKKPLAFGESSSEDDDECEHCFGHPEKRKKNAKHHDHGHGNDDSCALKRQTEEPSTSAQVAEPPAKPLPSDELEQPHTP